MKKYSVTRSVHFSYGHRLLDYDGKCARLHGHNGRALITVSADRLNDQGMVVDFYDISQTIGKWIQEHLDHRMILWKKDPIVQSLDIKKEGFVLMEENPTAEAIAKWIFQEAERLGLPVEDVTLWETENASASYRK